MLSDADAPKLRNPILIAAFEGWNDAGEAASYAAGYLARQWEALPFADGSFDAAIAVLSDSSWALAAGTARAWLARSPRRLELVGGTGGLVMIGIGASLALTGRKD